MKLSELFAEKGFKEISKGLAKGGARLAGRFIKNTPVGGVLDELGILEAAGKALGVEPTEQSIKDELTKLSPEQAQALLGLKNLETRMEMQNSYERMFLEQSIAERWKIDATGESWLSKNVRPLLIIALACNAFGVTYTLLIAAITGNLDEVTPLADMLMQGLLESSWMTFSIGLNAYFGLREIGKGLSKMFQSRREIQ